MEKLTYKQAFDKITEAYIKGEIKPFNANFCFCGTLCDNESNWGQYAPTINHNAPRNTRYSFEEFCSMEKALFTGMEGELKYEERLFNGMCAALEVLKQIHKERGESVEDFEFTKRELINN